MRRPTRTSFRTSSICSRISTKNTRVIPKRNLGWQSVTFATCSFRRKIGAFDPNSRARLMVCFVSSKRLKGLWERAKKQISESESRVRAESQLIHGEEFDVWTWIQPRSPSSPSSPRKKRAVSVRSRCPSSSPIESRSGVAQARPRRKLRLHATGCRSHRVLETTKLLRAGQVGRMTHVSMHRRVFCVASPMTTRSTWW